MPVSLQTAESKSQHEALRALRRDAAGVEQLGQPQCRCNIGLTWVATVLFQPWETNHVFF